MHIEDKDLIGKIELEIVYLKQQLEGLTGYLRILETENISLKKHISQMSCCCAGCTKHNLDLQTNNPI